MGRRGGAGKIVDLIDLYMEREADVVPHEFKAVGGEEVVDIFPIAGE